MINDQWNPSQRRFREKRAFCYGPLSCHLYTAGSTRKGPGTKELGEGGRLDEDAVARRDPDK